MCRVSVLPKALIIGVLSLAACSPTPAMTLRPSATLAPSTRPVASATSTPTPQPAFSPTVAVASATRQPTATPTNTISEATPTPQPSVTRQSPSATPPIPTATATACGYIWFFINPPTSCPAQPATAALTIAQHFEHGLMIWRAVPDRYGSQIYVFFYDNQWPYWNPTNDRWRPGQPEDDPTIVPPVGFYQPVRGFGIVWRLDYFGATIGSARDRLGWALAPEYSLGELNLQCQQTDSYEGGCYVGGPEGQVYTLFPNNTWQVWVGPTATP